MYYFHLQIKKNKNYTQNITLILNLIIGFFRKIHEKQREELIKHLGNILELSNNEEIENKLAATQECFV